MEYDDSINKTIALFISVHTDAKSIIIKRMDTVTILIFLLTCKLWKSWIESHFDYSYRKQLPLTFNYVYKHHKEVERLLEYNNVDFTCPDFIRSVIIRQDVPMLKRILQKPNINLNAETSKQFLFRYIHNYSVKLFSKANKECQQNASFKQSSIFSLCVQIKNTEILEQILRYDSMVICAAINDLSYLIQTSSSTVIRVVFKYITIDHKDCFSQLLSGYYAVMPGFYKTFLGEQLTKLNIKFFI